MAYNSTAPVDDDGGIGNLVTDGGSYEYDSISINPILSYEASLEHNDTIAISFNEAMDKLLENPENGDFFLLKPGQGNQTIHK